MRILRTPCFVLAATLIAVLQFNADPALAKKKDSGDKDQEKKSSILDIEDCPDQPGCDAIILLDETTFNNDQQYNTAYSRRQVIKLFTQEAVKKYANVQVTATKWTWQIKNLRGKTILPDGTEIRLEEENITEKTLKQGKSKVRVKSATFPGVVPGAIIYWGIDKETESHTFMTQDEWGIQQELPVYKARYILKPGKYNLGWEQTGFDKVNVEVEQPDKRTWVFTATNVPPIPDEPYGPYDRAMQARMFFFLPEIRNSWLGSFGGRFAGFSGSFIQTTPEIEKAVGEITSADDSERDKVRKIYDFVQQEIGTEEERLAETEEANLEDAANAGDVLSHGYGDEIDRTLLFLALVKAAGMEPGLLVIANRFNGPLELEIPDEDIFDSFAAAVKIGSRWQNYDPATRHCPLGMISPEKESDLTNGIRLTPDPDAGGQISIKIKNLSTGIVQPVPLTMIQIPLTPARKNLFSREATLKLGTDGSGEIELTEVGSGQVDLSRRQDYEFLDDEERRDRLQNRLAGMFEGLEIVNAEFQDFSSFEKPGTVECRIRVPKIATSVGDRLIVTPSVFHAGDRNPFSAEIRKASIMFPFASSLTETIQVDIPEGYTIEALPEPVGIDDPPLSLSVSYSRRGNGFRLVRRVDIDTAVWPVDDYDRLKSFFETLQKADRQVVTLTRSEGS